MAMPGGRSLYDVAKVSIEHGRDSVERQRMIDIQPILDLVCHWSAMLKSDTKVAISQSNRKIRSCVCVCKLCSGQGELAYNEFL